mgnify:CR=1 FL=1
MIAGHLQEKKGLYYMVLSYKDKSGKRISKWLPTGLPVKGNKKRAEDMLMAARAEFVAGEKPLLTVICRFPAILSNGWRSRGAP